MAVYTKINKKDISYINQKFEVEKIIDFKGIKNFQACALFYRNHLKSE